MLKDHITYVSKSVVGKRSNNEDAIICEEIGPELYFFAVADGMGGADAGEVASRLALEGAILCLKEREIDIINRRKSLKDCIVDAFCAAQTQIADDKLDNPSRHSMGTTLSMALMYKRRYAIGNIGDSRIYLLRRHRLKLLTSDHSFVFEESKKNKKKLSLDFIRKYGHLVTKVLDGSNIKPDVFPKRRKSFKFRKNDRLLLCSDGLIIPEVYSDTNELENLLKEQTSSDKHINKLIDWAEDNGSMDNISIALVAT